MLVSKKYNRKWLRLIFLLYPAISPLLFALPFIPVYFINRYIKKILGISGTIKSIRFSPFVIRIRVKGLTLESARDTGDDSFFASAESIYISVGWSQLWNGTLWVETQCIAPAFTYTKRVSVKESESIVNSTSSFDPDMDIIIDKLELVNAKIEFIDTTSSPQVLLEMHNIHVTASSVAIGPQASGITADIIMNGELYAGKLHAHMHADLQAPFPDFKVEASISGINMVLLNNLFRAYGKFDIHNGTMSMRTEVTAKDREYKGYVEPVIKDLEVMGPEDSHDSILKFLWKAVIGAVAELLEDHSNDKLEAIIEFNQPFKNPTVHIGMAVLEVLGAAFLHGLTPYMKKEIKIEL